MHARNIRKMRYIWCVRPSRVSSKCSATWSCSSTTSGWREQMHAHNHQLGACLVSDATQPSISNLRGTYIAWNDFVCLQSNVIPRFQHWRASSVVSLWLFKAVCSICRVSLLKIASTSTTSLSVFKIRFRFEGSHEMDVKMWDSEITRSQMLDTIGALQVLQKVPHKPRENPIKLVPEVHRSLSLVEEQDITSKLAFLSSTSPSNLEVMAVCFEEGPKGDGAIIRLASNTGVPPVVTDGFRKLSKILMKAASRSNCC